MSTKTISAKTATPEDNDYFNADRGVVSAPSLADAVAKLNNDNVKEAKVGDEQ